MLDMLPVFEEDEAAGVTFATEESPGGDDDIAPLYSSRVDNHYSLQGAYLTYGEIVRRINGASPYDLKYPQGEEITFRKVEAPYLGSRQRKLMDTVPIDEHLYEAVFREDIPSPERITVSRRRLQSILMRLLKTECHIFAVYGRRYRGNSDRYRPPGTSVGADFRRQLYQCGGGTGVLQL